MFRSARVRNLWALIVADAGLDVMGVVRCELEDFVFLIEDHPLADHAPVAEIAGDPQFGNRAEEIAGEPRTVGGASAVSLHGDDDVVLVLNSNNTFMKAQGVRRAPCVVTGHGVDEKWCTFEAAEHAIFE